MTIRNARIRQDRIFKKTETPAFSSSGIERSHFITQSIKRTGAVKPVCRKKILEMIRRGSVVAKKQGHGKVLLIFKESGDKVVVNKKFTSAITFIN